MKYTYIYTMLSNTVYICIYIGTRNSFLNLDSDNPLPGMASDTDQSMRDIRDLPMSVSDQLLKVFMYIYMYMYI
jgi:hypothetical protein